MQESSFLFMICLSVFPYENYIKSRHQWLERVWPKVKLEAGFVFLLIAEKHDLRRKPGHDNMNL